MKRLTASIILCACLGFLGGCYYPYYYQRPGVVYDDGTSAYADGYGYYGAPGYYAPGYYYGAPYAPYPYYGWAWPWIGFGFSYYYGGGHYHGGGYHGGWHGGHH